MKLRDIILGADFIASLLLTAATALFSPAAMPISVAKDFYSTGIAVLSIIFSVFFAALAIIMTASSDDFVLFLDQEGEFRAIVSTFRFTLAAQFVSLLVSIALFAYCSVRQACGIQMHSKWWMTIFVALFSYSLLAVAQSIRDAIQYSIFRIRYISLRQKPHARAQRGNK